MSSKGVANRQGPLTGVKIVEFTGIGPAPFGAMLLADLGATIIRIDRPGGYPPLDPALDFDKMGAAAIFNRSRHALRVDLKSEEGQELVRRLVADADALIEGYRPGTMERLGLGPDDCLALNPRLVYARMTGWGQEGPLARVAGHDINYIGLSGALSLFGDKGVPTTGIPPLIGDMGGGGLMMALGLLAAVISARQTGQGQVVDAAIVDGSAALYSLIMALHAAGVHDSSAGTNTLDGGRHYYRQYTCKDGGHVAVGAIEPAFRRLLLEKLDLMGDPRFLSGKAEDEAYCHETLEALFATRTRDEWAAFFDGSDACVTPVLSMTEAPVSDLAKARDGFVTIDDVAQHAPAPRFSQTPGAVSVSPKDSTVSSPNALTEWGFGDAEIEALLKAKVIE